MAQAQAVRLERVEGGLGRFNNLQGRPARDEREFRSISGRIALEEVHMNLFGGNIYASLKSYIQSITDKAKSAIGVYKQKVMGQQGELAVKRAQVQKLEEELGVVTGTNLALEKENDALRHKLKTYELITGDSTKIQRLIIAFKQMKFELLHLRRYADSKMIENEELQRKNTKLELLLKNATESAPVDINKLYKKMVHLKKENSNYKMKCCQMETTIKNFASKEQRRKAKISLKYQ
ncbi:MAG: hypothetical protein ACLGSA_10835 [Acidobacteriota bacterium]